MSKKNYSTPSLIAPLFVKTLNGILTLLLLLVGIATLPAQEVGNLTIIKEATPEDDTPFEFIGAGPGFRSHTPVFESFWSIKDTHFQGINNDAEGNIYVSDNDNRINKFDRDGNFLRAWGWGVATGANQLEVCTSNCLEGIAGIGNGQLDSPDHLVVDENGNVYVATNNRRIHKFDSDGNYITQWGGSGSTEGFLGDLKDIAIDAAGNIYAGDATYNRVQKFDSDGNFLLMWGWGVADGSMEFQTCTSGCQSGIDGAGDGQFGFISSIVVDKDGQVYVGDFNNGNIQVFDTNGNYLRQWSQGDPDDMILNVDGDLIVLSNNSVRKFDTEGNIQNNLSLNDQINRPKAIMTDSKGNLYVAGTGSSDGIVEKYVPTSFVLQDPSSNSIQFIDYDTGTYHITEVLPADWELSNISCTGGAFSVNDNSLTVQLTEGADITCTFSNNLPLGNITIVKEALPEDDTPFDFHINGRNFDLDTLPFEQVYSSTGNTSGLLNGPHDIALDVSNNIYVTDYLNNRIQKFDSNGNFILEWGTTGTAEGLFNKPIYLAIDANNNIWVTEWSNNRVQQFDANGDFIKMIGWGVATGAAQFEMCTTGCQAGVNGTGDGQFSTPSGIAIDQDGFLFITEETTERIQKFDSDGNFLSSFSTVEDAYSFGMTIDKTGDIYVADQDQYLVHKYSNDGTFLLTLGPENIGKPTILVEPYDVAIDEVGNVYIAGEGADKIHKFDSNGNFLSEWGASGSGDNEFNSPRGVAFDSNGNLYVADYSNDRIKKYGSGNSYFSLMDPSANTKVFTNLRAGDYTIAELLPDNWDLSNITCTAGNPQIGDTSVTITLTGGADISCTFSNECNTDCETSLEPCTIDDLNIDENNTSVGTFHTVETITSTRTIKNNTTVVFKAGTSITLQAGFHAIAGSNFTATIEACPATLVASEARSQTKLDKTIEVFPEVKVFPNPVQSHTNISISLSEAQEIQLDIYDLNGRRITTIVPVTHLFAGTHLFEWSCEQAEAGIYFVVMNGRQVGRLAIIK